MAYQGDVSAKAASAGGSRVWPPGGAVRRYVYDGDHVLMETNGAGARERMYSYDPGVDQPHSVREFGGSLAGRYYYLIELPGHVSGMVDEDGALVNEYRYSAFGRAELARDSVPNTLRFMAREWDADAGLYYVRNRWYNPQVGRFVSEDPIGIEGGINLYVYAMNDPMGRLDPYGLTSDPCTLLAVLQMIIDGWSEQMINAHCGGGAIEIPEVVVTASPSPFGTDPVADMSKLLMRLAGHHPTGFALIQYHRIVEQVPCAEEVTVVGLSFVGGKVARSAGAATAATLRETGYRLYRGGHRAWARSLLREASEAENALPWKQHRSLDYQAASWLPVVGGRVAAYEATTCIMETC